MTGGIIYFSAFLEDVNFGAVINSFRFRWTSSYIANPEHKPEDMLKAVMQSLTSFECTYTLFMVVIILPVWDDTPWISTKIRGHGNMSTLIHIPTGHMRFVTAHKPSDEATVDLSPVK
jgi:hypothetical protein